MFFPAGLTEAVHAIDGGVVSTQRFVTVTRLLLPPITLLTAAHLMSTLVDAVVLVVRAGATPLPAIQKAVESIGQDRILGIVLNHADTSEIPESYSYYAGHTDGSGA